MVPDSTNAFYAEYAHQIQRAAGELGYALLMTNSGFDPDVELRGMLDLCDRQIDGLILARWAVGDDRRATRRGVHTRVVLIDSTTALPGYATVGPEAPAVLRSPWSTSWWCTTMLGWGWSSVTRSRPVSTDAKRDGRRPMPEQDDTWVSSSRTGSTARAVTPLGLGSWNAKTDPTAVITSSDLQAVGLLRAAHELNVRVPIDLAVTSYDGTAETKFCWPSLTTIRQPTSQMAEAAVRAVLTADQPGHQTFAMDLLLRRSCGCPRP